MQFLETMFCKSTFAQCDRENDRIGFPVTKTCVRLKCEQALPGSVLESKPSQGLAILKIMDAIVSIISFIACVNVQTKRDNYAPIQDFVTTKFHCLY